LPERGTIHIILSTSLLLQSVINGSDLTLEVPANNNFHKGQAANIGKKRSDHDNPG
jgi:hypothetical protein